MFARIRQALAAPVFEDDEDKTRIARLLNSTLLILLATTVLGTAAVIAVEPPSEWAFSIAFGVVMTAITLALRAFLHRGHVRAIGTILALALWAGITLLLAVSGGLGNTAVVAYFLLIGVTNLLLGKRLGIFLTFLIILTTGGLFYAETNGLIEPRIRDATQPTDLTMLVITLVLTTVIARFIVNSTTQSLERARRGESAAAERSRELEASQRITFAASERMSPDELLGLVVDLIRDQFHLYHVQAYIVDEEQQAAVLRESTGYAGHQLLEREHHIPLDRPALVTRAVRTGRPVLVPDVSQDPEFMSNPLLPDTRSELVVPLKIGERVIGVLDAQARTPGHFTERTAALFQTMAEQIAFLFENSELLENVSKQTETLTVMTNQLRTAAEIARRLAAILDPERLLHEAVSLLQSRFHLYHAHVYVVDRDDGLLVVRAGSGEVGRVLCARGYSIPLGAKNLVARAARSHKTVVVNDTSLESDFVPTPLLPQTRSEMAIPLMAGDRVLGVLDTQDNQANRFTQIDTDTLETLAGQIATALQNAALFEEIQAASEQLREAGRLKDELLTKTNHELRTPLNSIIGYTEIMLMGIEGILDHKGLEQVQAIYDSGQQLLHVINDLLDLAGIEAGHLELDFEEVQLKPLVDEISSDITRLGGVNKPVALITEVEEQLPPIWGDRARLKQILNNIVANVANYTAGESIKLYAFTDHDVQSEDGWIYIAFQESNSDKRNVKQADNFASWSAEWASLGLILTRHLVEMHGGEISTFSQFGQESILTVRLPVRGHTPKAARTVN